MYVLSLTVCKNLSKASHYVSLFIVNFSRIFEEHALTVLPSNSLDDCISWRFDGPCKSEGVSRLILVEFSAVFFLLILSAIMVTVTTAKMLKASKDLGD